MGRIKTGIIGIGEIGSVHARNVAALIPGAELVALADRRLEAAQKAARELSVPSALGDYRAMLEDRSIEAVLICTTPDSHARIIEEAAASKKHIFCEKPVGISEEEILKALAAVRGSGVKLQVGFNRRFDPHFQRVRRLIAENRIGTVQLLRLTSRDPEPPSAEYYRVSGGIFLDMTIHDLDLARYLVADEASELYANGSVLIDPGIGAFGDADTLAVTLKFKGGALAVIDNSCRAVFGYDQRLEVLGASGMIGAGNPLPDTCVVADGSGFHSPPLLHFFVDRYRESYLRELEAFFEAIRRDEEPPVTGNDGWIAARMAFAAAESLRSRRAVRLPEGGP